jgi:hypothetical protein
MSDSVKNAPKIGPILGRARSGQPFSSSLCSKIKLACPVSTRMRTDSSTCIPSHFASFAFPRRPPFADLSSSTHQQSCFPFSSLETVAYRHGASKGAQSVIKNIEHWAQPASRPSPSDMTITHVSLPVSISHMSPATLRSSCARSRRPLLCLEGLRTHTPFSTSLNVSLHEPTQLIVLPRPTHSSVQCKLHNEKATPRTLDRALCMRVSSQSMSTMVA